MSRRWWCCNLLNQQYSVYALIHALDMGFHWIYPIHFGPNYMVWIIIPVTE